MRRCALHLLRHPRPRSWSRTGCGVDPEWTVMIEKQYSQLGEQTMPKNNILNFGAPLVNVVFQLSCCNKNLEINKELAAIEQFFQQFEKSAREHNLPDKDAYYIKYALAAFVDEIIGFSELKNCQQWRANPLQLRLFNEHMAGEGFFEKLQELQQDISENIDLLELYNVCLELGFQGRYRMHEAAELLTIKKQLNKQILLVRGRVENNFFIASENSNGQQRSKFDFSRLSFIATVAFGLVCFIYLAYFLAINYQAGKLFL